VEMGTKGEIVYAGLPYSNRRVEIKKGGCCPSPLTLLRRGTEVQLKDSALQKALKVGTKSSLGSASCGDGKN